MASSIGSFTYGAEHIKVKSWGEGTVLTIGKFCSIAGDVTVLLGGNHRTDWVTTYPFGHVHQSTFPCSGIGHPSTNGNVIIGNDVWVGMGVTIMSGITIGDGAVIADNSHVVKSVPSYAIVGGNPATVIRSRFEPHQIESLLAIRWWDWPTEKIAANVSGLSSPNVDALIAFGKSTMMVKILNLVIYTPTVDYEQLMRAQLAAAVAAANTAGPHIIQQYFVAMRDQVAEVIIEGDIIWVRGAEDHMLNILDKTLRALRYCLENLDFDLVVRSNVSTAINFRRFPINLALTAGYSAPHCLQLDWLDPGSGIIDHSYRGVRYASGTCFTLNRAAVSALLSVVPPPIIDDVAVGVMLAGRFPLQKLPVDLVEPRPDGTFVYHVGGAITTNVVVVRHKTPCS